MTKEDCSYYLRRAAQEKIAADRATHAAAAKAHETLAQQYSAMAEGQDEQSEMR